jgi:hypothetical protein
MTPAVTPGQDRWSPFFTSEEYRIRLTGLLDPNFFSPITQDEKYHTLNPKRRFRYIKGIPNKPHEHCESGQMLRLKTGQNP